MNASSRGRGWLAAWLAAGLLGSQVPAFAQETAPSTAEVVVAIKRRAQQILEERRRAKRLRVSWDISQLVGYESNPANGPDHIGDTYFEQSVYGTFSKKLAPTITWQGIYSGSYDNYVEYGDGDYMSHTLTPVKLLWQPGRMWRVDTGADFNITYYPRSKGSNYRDLKPFVGVRQNLWGTWFQTARYEWFIRDYISKQARDGNSAETLSNRVDTRHRLRYELGTTWQEALLKVKQEWYSHDSNDARNDFYDAQDYKVTASVNRNLTEKFSANASYSFERKNYEHRPVTGITAEARYDDTQTWTVAGTYDFNNTWSFAPSFSYKFLDSNEPTGEYVDTTITGTLSARF
ncbi:MAG: hypothetical protein HYS41_00995 [Candidatus Omnitrophica bacterium]|nr:hypothetical protein [Candidatus Omnitrophota bacterium]